MKFAEAILEDKNKQGIRRNSWLNENHRYTESDNGYIFDEDNNQMMLSKYDILEADDWEIYEEVKNILNKEFTLRKTNGGLIKILSVSCVTPTNPDNVIQEIEKLLKKDKIITLKIIDIDEGF